MARVLANGIGALRVKIIHAAWCCDGTSRVGVEGARIPRFPRFAVETGDLCDIRTLDLWAKWPYSEAK